MERLTRGYKIAFEITVDGFVEFLRWRQRRLNIAAATVAVALLSFNLLSLALGTPIEFALFFSFPAVLLLIFVVTPWADRWRVQRAARSLLGTTATCRIGPTGIDGDQAGMTSHVDWGAITRVVDNGRVVVVMRDRLPVMWIPASAFASNQERDEVVNFMRDAMRKSAA
jgi:hypothetical protein